MSRSKFVLIGIWIIAGVVGNSGLANAGNICGKNREPRRLERIRLDTLPNYLTELCHNSTDEELEETCQYLSEFTFNFKQLHYTEENQIDPLALSYQELQEESGDT